MKKLAYILLALVVVFTFASCKDVTEEYEYIEPISLVESEKFETVLREIYKRAETEVLSGEYTIASLPSYGYGTISSGRIYWVEDKLHIDFYFTGKGETPSFSDIKTVFTTNEFDTNNITVSSVGACSTFLTAAETKTWVCNILDESFWSLENYINFCNAYVTGTRTVVYSLTDDISTTFGEISEDSTIKATYSNYNAKTYQGLNTNVSIELKAWLDEDPYFVNYTPYKNIVTFGDGSKYIGTTEFGDCLCGSWD